MSDLAALQDFINRLDEHLSKTSAVPGRNADTGEALARKFFGGATFPTEPRDVTAFLPSPAQSCRDTNPPAHPEPH